MCLAKRCVRFACIVPAVHRDLPAALGALRWWLIGAKLSEPNDVTALFATPAETRSNSKTQVVTQTHDPWVGSTRSQPLHQTTHTHTHTHTHTGRGAVTIFERESVADDGSESIVRCMPITGRQHQIRVHLQWLGEYMRLLVMYDSKGKCPVNGKEIPPK